MLPLHRVRFFVHPQHTVSVFSYTLNVSVFDLIILAILAALTLRGIWKGMISQIVSVASFFICWIVATRFGSLVAPTIPLEAPWNQVAAAAIIFLVTLIAIRFAYTALEQLIKNWHLQKVNTLLGGLLGFTKGLLLCLIVTFFSVMLSETSRAVVFNSKSGSHLVQLITRISLFVPKDSYEFVHTQFAQFQNQVDKAVPGKTPEMLPVQSSETAQQVLAQLQQTRNQTESSASSLLTALSKWWNGSSDDTTEMETVARIPQTAPINGQRASTYTPPALSLPPSPVQPAETFANIPQPATPRPTAVGDFFTRQTTPPVQQMQQLAALPSIPSSIPEIPSHQSSSLSPLAMLAPLSESLPTLPESTQLSPTLPTSHPVGSELLLRNSGRTTNSNTSAQVFRAQ